MRMIFTWDSRAAYGGHPRAPGHAPHGRFADARQRIEGVDAAGCHVFGCSMHEAERGRYQPSRGQVAAKRSGALARFDEVLTPLQDPAMAAAKALGRELVLRGQEKVAELAADVP
jgi:hypothetical protein